MKLADNKDNGRKEMARTSLSNRVYLGPTSTDNEIATLMASQARVQPGDKVLDPFVGTGSLLLGAALRGAHCTGIDLDGRVINGSGVGKLNRKSTFYSKFITRGLILIISTKSKPQLLATCIASS